MSEEEQDSDGKSDSYDIQPYLFESDVDIQKSKMIRLNQTWRLIVCLQNQFLCPSQITLHLGAIVVTKTYVRYICVKCWGGVIWLKFVGQNMSELPSVFSKMVRGEFYELKSDLSIYSAKLFITMIL